MEGLIFTDLFLLGTAHLFRDVVSGWVFQVFILFWSVVFQIGFFCGADFCRSGFVWFCVVSDRVFDFVCFRIRANGRQVSGRQGNGRGERRVRVSGCQRGQEKDPGGGAR